MDLTSDKPHRLLPTLTDTHANDKDEAGAAGFGERHTQHHHHPQIEEWPVTNGSRSDMVSEQRQEKEAREPQPNGRRGLLDFGADALLAHIF